MLVWLASLCIIRCFDVIRHVTHTLKREWVGTHGPSVKFVYFLSFLFCMAKFVEFPEVSETRLVAEESWLEA